MTDFTGFLDESSSNLQVRELNSSTDNLSTMPDINLSDLDNPISSQENSQSELNNSADSQGETDSKNNPRLSFEAIRAEKQIPPGSVKKTQAIQSRPFVFARRHCIASTNTLCIITYDIMMLNPSVCCYLNRHSML